MDGMNDDNEKLHDETEEIRAETAADSPELQEHDGLTELQKQLALRGSYARPMNAADTVRFIHGEQQQWKPVLDQMATKTN